VVRLEHFGAFRTHFPHEFRVIIFWRLDIRFKYSFAATQLDFNPLLYLPRPLYLPVLEFNLVGVNVVQAEQIGLDGKHTIRGIADRFWGYVISSGQGESNGAHQRVILSPNGAVQNEHNPYGKQNIKEASQGYSPINLPGGVINLPVKQRQSSFTLRRRS
jgi:hypothetical protein